MKIFEVEVDLDLANGDQNVIFMPYSNKTMETKIRERALLLLLTIDSKSVMIKSEMHFGAV